MKKKIEHAGQSGYPQVKDWKARIVSFQNSRQQEIQ
jgi:hypothetical protein